MKIRDKKGSSGVSGVGGLNRGGKKGGKGEKVESDVHVEISSKAQTVEEIKRLVAGSPEVRVDSVEEIVNLLKEGKYKLNYEQIADSFIKDIIQNELSARRSR